MAKIFSLLAMSVLFACAGTDESGVEAVQSTEIKYEIYLNDVSKPEVLEYIKIMTRKASYRGHRLLKLNDSYAEIVYTALELPEVVYGDTADFFKDYTVDIATHVIKVRR
ncbi:MAG: hypothetical protein LBQ63_03955 [Deltaproteobacteria bacterium]|jgi:hypothetical protein|nr:hypothetical protein [Deltaproteobacteria bacterium]